MFKVSQFDPKTLRWWISQRTKIDMEPSYQRHGRLWSTTDKAFLVDSILNEYDVPKIYMADFTFGTTRLNKQGLSYAIIDGKQRLEAIFDFFDGKLVLDPEFVFQQNPVLKLSGLGYSDLKQNHQDVADIFDNYPLSVMRVITDDESKINELFVRLNRSKPLTGAEIRNAMGGPAPQTIRHIAKHEFFTTNVKFTVNRGQDLNAAAKLLLFEYHNELRETKKRNLDDFVREVGKKPNDRLEVAGRRVIDVLEEMTEIFLPSDILLASAGVFPVYYWFVRNTDADLYHRVRKFLVDFEDARRENRHLIAKDPNSSNIDRKLAQYDKYNRSTDDRQSHKVRYELLTERFATQANTPSN